MSWRNTTLSAGGVDHTYDVFQQHDKNNCGPSSIVMLVRQRLQKHVSIGFTQLSVGLSEQSSGKRDQSGADARWHAWGDDPKGGYSFMDDLESTLKEKWPALKASQDQTGSSHRAKLAACTPAKPALAHVAWVGGGGHFIVCLGKHGTDMLWLDPFYGVVLCPHQEDATGDGLEYKTNQGSFGQGSNTGWSRLGIYTDP